MDKIKIRYNNWDAVPISIYKKIVDLNNDEGMDTMERNVASLAVLCDVTENDIWNLSMDEIAHLTKKLDWINEFDFKKRWTIKTVKLGNNTYKVTYDIHKMTVAQYIDFQTAWKINNATDKLVPVLACFLVPEGKKYGEGYDIEDVKNDIENNMPITMANSVCFFFMKKLRNSIKASLTCSQMILKAAKMTTKDKNLKQKMREADEKMTQMLNFYFNG